MTDAPFDAREALAEAEAEYKPFEFIGLDDETYTLPNPYLLSTATLRKQLELEEDDDIADVDPLDFLTKVVPESWAAIQAMPELIQGRLVDAWRTTIEDMFEADDSGKELGKSSAPNRAARRSKPTSRSAGKTSGRSRSGK